jgi:hypothetical protein
VRALLGIKPRDKVRFKIEGGEVSIQRLEMTLEEAFGSVPPLRDVGDVNEQLRIAKDEKAVRTMRRLRRK